MTEERKKEIRGSLEVLSNLTKNKQQLLYNLDYITIWELTNQNLSPNIEDNIERTLEKMGFPKNKPGSKYFQEAIHMVIFDHITQDIGERIYLVLSRKYNHCKQNIVSAMNTAMNIAWNYGSMELQGEIFGYNKENLKRPSIKAAIISIAKYVVTLNDLFSQVAESISILLNITNSEIATLFDYLPETEVTERNDAELKQKIQQEIKNVGISHHLLGFTYLQNLVYELVRRDSSHIGKAILLIAKNSNRSENAITGDIRIAIKDASNKNLPAFQELLKNYSSTAKITVKTVAMALVKQVLE